MSLRTMIAGLAALLLLAPSEVLAEHKGKVQIVLLGDSSTEGSVPRRHVPKGPHLEAVVTQLLAAEDDLPQCHTINLGLSGDTIRQLLDSGRYDKQCASLPGVDYVFIRYGINDYNRSRNFVEEFPRDFKALIARLRRDQPQAVLIPSTIISIDDGRRSTPINDAIRHIAEDEKLPLFDLYRRYAGELKAQGPNALNYRRYKLAKIPKQYHAYVQPFVVGDSVEVMDNRLDAHFGHLPGWYADRHPNLAGYHVIGDETAKYLIPLIRAARSKAKGAAPPRAAPDGAPNATSSSSAPASASR